MKDEKLLERDRKNSVRITGENSKITIENGLCFIETDGKKQRAFLHLAFPYDMSDGYISVLDSDENEIGMILNLSDLDNDSRAAAETELSRRYLTPKIKTLINMKEKGGFAFWEVDTDLGRKEFTVRDNFRNIFRVGELGAIIYDIDGNRFMIDDVTALDRRSRKKIELYL